MLKLHDIIHFYYMGESYREISEKTGRAIYKLTALHNRSIKKLKNRLAVFVRERFGVKNKKIGKCPVCDSEYRGEIDEIIANRDKKATWKPVIKLLKDRYGLVINTPQVLIGHTKYHCKPQKK